MVQRQRAPEDAPGEGVGGGAVAPLTVGGRQEGLGAGQGGRVGGGGAGEGGKQILATQAPEERWLVVLPRFGIAKRIARRQLTTTF